MEIKIKSSLGEIVLQEPSFGQVADILDNKSDIEFVSFLNTLQDKAGKSKIVFRDLPYTEYKKVISDFFIALNQPQKK